MPDFFRKTQNQEDSFDDFPPIGGLMASKMIVDENRKPRFMYREKRTRPEDSGWRIFSGFETDAYNDDPANIGIYNPSTVLKIDPSIKDLLLKGIGSVYEKTENDEWYKVLDFDLEDDFMTTHRLTEKWIIEINNLFERSIEADGTLYYTTGDKSIRLAVWNSDKDKQELYTDYNQDIESRDQSKDKTLEKFEFSDKDIARIGYLIEEHDSDKTYSVIYGFSIIDQGIIQIAIYFDERSDFDWAINTWKSIQIKK